MQTNVVAQFSDAMKFNQGFLVMQLDWQLQPPYRLHVVRPTTDRPWTITSKISLSSRTPLLSSTLLSPIIGVIKDISFLLIVESSFHRRETKHHHRHLINETCGCVPFVTYRSKNKCQASKRKNSGSPYSGIRSEYRSSQPPDFYIWYGNITSIKSKWRWAAPRRRF